MAVYTLGQKLSTELNRFTSADYHYDICQSTKYVCVVQQYLMLKLIITKLLFVTDILQEENQVN